MQHRLDIDRVEYSKLGDLHVYIHVHVHVYTMYLGIDFAQFLLGPFVIPQLETEGRMALQTSDQHTCIHVHGTVSKLLVALVADCTVT